MTSAASAARPFANAGSLMTTSGVAGDCASTDTVASNATIGAPAGCDPPARPPQPEVSMVRRSIVSGGPVSVMSICVLAVFLSTAALFSTSVSAAPGGQARGAQARGAQAFMPERPAGCPLPPPSLFGTKEKTEVSMEGKIYFLPEKSAQLPDFSA